MPRRHGVQYASFDVKSAPLFGDFGLEYATKLFGEETIASLPRYVRGPKKGKIKAYLIWTKCTEGGWSNSGVAVPGLHRAMIAPFPYAGERDALRGKWCGQDETLSLPRAYLFAEGRASRMKELERTTLRNQLDFYEIQANEAQSSWVAEYAADRITTEELVAALNIIATFKADVETRRQEDR